MKHLPISAMMMVLFVSTLTLADQAKAHGEKAHQAKAHDAKAVTVKGEIVDLGCYLAHAGKGADHKSCAQKCVNGGMPMGVLAADGKLYLLTLNHDNADPFNQAKTLVAEMVEVSGPVYERSGMKMIDVVSVKSVNATTRPAESK